PHEDGRQPRLGAARHQPRCALPHLAPHHRRHCFAVDRPSHEARIAFSGAPPGEASPVPACARLESMIVGGPREVKEEESRVALTPSGVGAFVAHGHRVLVEYGAGAASSLPDRLYRDAGATLVDAPSLWGSAELVLKVKEPLPSEYALLRPDVVLFTYLHLPANPELGRVLRERGVSALAYETLQLDDGSLPLLAPMSEVAGRLAVQVGAWCLQAQNGGRGVLLSGASGVRPAKVVILGAGIAGTNACQVAVGTGAHVSILDVDPGKLRYVHDILGGHVTTVMSNRANVEEEVMAADLVVGAVLIPGALAPRLLP